MKTILGLARWIFRIYFILVIIENYYYDPIGPFLIIISGELITSAFSMLRFEADIITRNITGFIGNNDYGTYEYNSNLGARIIGYLFLIIALIFRIIMLVFIIESLT
jgi:uncharacterized membrane protein